MTRNYPHVFRPQTPPRYRLTSYTLTVISLPLPDHRTDIKGEWCRHRPTERQTARLDSCKTRRKAQKKRTIDRIVRFQMWAALVDKLFNDGGPSMDTREGDK